MTEKIKEMITLFFLVVPIKVHLQLTSGLSIHIYLINTKSNNIHNFCLSFILKYLFNCGDTKL